MENITETISFFKLLEHHPDFHQCEDCFVKCGCYYHFSDHDWLHPPEDTIILGLISALGTEDAFKITDFYDLHGTTI
jgi:hypothetical protein